MASTHRVITRTQKKNLDAIFAPNATATCYSYDNGFCGAPVQDLSFLRQRVEEKRGQLRVMGPDKFCLYVHSNLWFDIVTPNCPVH